jgi:large subunit ribosomal protein L20
MTRVKRGIISQKRKRRILKAAKGYRGQRSKKERAANDALKHAGAHAFAHRKDKKNVMRNLWTVRINAASRSLGIKYNTLINNMKNHNVQIDRKILSTIAEKNPEVFKTILEKVSK